MRSETLYADDDGAEVIEFIGLLPVILLVGLLMIQILVAAQTFLIASSAAREGARAGAVGESINDAVARSSSGYDRQIEVRCDGHSVYVTVRLKIRLFRLFSFLEGQIPRAEGRAVMRLEADSCP